MLRVRCESLARMGHELEKLYTNLLLAEPRDLAQADYELSKMHKMIRQHRRSCPQCSHNERLWLSVRIQAGTFWRNSVSTR
jgi:hypothetical protein